MADFVRTICHYSTRQILNQRLTWDNFTPDKSHKRFPLDIFAQVKYETKRLACDIFPPDKSQTQGFPGIFLLELNMKPEACLGYF